MTLKSSVVPNDIVREWDRKHMWYPNDLVRLWNRIELNLTSYSLRLYSQVRNERLNTKNFPGITNSRNILYMNWTFLLLH